MGYKLEKIGKIVALLKSMEQYYKTKEHEKHIDKIFSDMTEAYNGLFKQLGITNVVEERKDMESLFGGRTDEVISTILKDYEKRVAEDQEKAEKYVHIIKGPDEILGPYTKEDACEYANKINKGPVRCMALVCDSKKGAELHMSEKETKKNISIDNKNHLEFIHCRMVELHGENKDIDYMKKFKEIIETL